MVIRRLHENVRKNMKILTIFAIVFLVLVTIVQAKDFVVGTRINNLLISTEKVIYNGFPLIRRDKDYKYTDPKDRKIKGIIARDLSRTGAEVAVTGGGVGDTYVTLHFTSERGLGLNYLVLIFSDNK